MDAIKEALIMVACMMLISLAFVIFVCMVYAICLFIYSNTNRK
jgi:hypothetical protein